MNKMQFGRYQAHSGVVLPDRTWPNRTIIKAPIWCSVCLRDGNQALMNPMNVATKRRMFDLLAKVGLKQIEVGFPAASQIDFDFARMLIDKNLIPDDVTIQVLVQSRPEQIRQTFEAVKGAKRVIVHLYNSTSTLQREVVFSLDRRAVIELALDGVRLIKRLVGEYPETEWTLQYSPESFTGTELDFAEEICNAVVNIWQPTSVRPMIINLPATVEICTPNVYADMIEYMCRHIARRDCVIISLHTHNDRGTGIAASEMGMLAGADRIEGTLLGNGERTGNADIVTLALNLFSQGVNPELDFSDITEVRRVVEECTGIKVHPRHPYAGDMAFTAYSGSHQDAIKKGMRALKRKNSAAWNVPYLHIDPRDIGRTYKGLVQITSQSGKGGIEYIMKEEHGLELPRGLLIDFSSVIQKVAEKTGTVVPAQDVLHHFEIEYLQRVAPLEIVQYVDLPSKGGREITATINVHGVQRDVVGNGNGPVSAFVDALSRTFNFEMSVVDLHEHAIGSGTDASAIAYVPIHLPGREPVWGAGRAEDMTAASLRAVVCAVNRSDPNILG